MQIITAYSLMDLTANLTPICAYDLALCKSSLLNYSLMDLSANLTAIDLASDILQVGLNSWFPTIAKFNKN